MARCSAVLCMLLLPCMMTGHLLIYVLVSIFVTISSTPPQVHYVVHYVAPGVSSTPTSYWNSSTSGDVWAPVPLAPFWNLRLEDGALWNHLQHVWDRRHNPVLRGWRGRGVGDANHTATKAGAEELPGEEGCHQDGDLGGLPEQMRAFVLAMHRRKYRLLIDQPDICTGGGNRSSDQDRSSFSPPMLLMAIKSQVGNFENRQAIRESWGRSGFVKGDGSGGGLVRTVFLLGRQDSSTGPHPDLGNLLELESRHHADILQWDFRDTFFNLTLKDLLFWRWLGRRCPGAAFVFKGDDDVLVRTGALLDFLRRRRAEVLGNPNQTQDDPEFFVGDVITDAEPNREPDGKYYVPESFYRGAYPPYAGGGGVVYSGALAHRLRRVSDQVRLFPIDDVYLGMCLRRLGLAPSHHPGFLTFDLPESQHAGPCAYRSVLLVHRRSPRQMLSLWRQLQEVHC